MSQIDRDYIEQFLNAFGHRNEVQSVLMTPRIFDLLRVPPKPGVPFKWCACRHFRDLCTHTWQDDPEVFRW